MNIIDLGIKIFIFLLAKLFHIHQSFIENNCDLWIRKFGSDVAFRMFSLLDSKSFIAVLQKLGASIGENVRIVTPIAFINFSNNMNNLIIGNNCHIGRDVLFDLAAPLEIQDNVTVSMRCNLITHINIGDVDTIRQAYPNKTGGVVIRSNVYIGCGATILHNVIIGSNSIIGAGALVNRSIPEDSIAKGVPAKVERII